MNEAYVFEFVKSGYLLQLASLGKRWTHGTRDYDLTRDADACPRNTDALTDPLDDSRVAPIWIQLLKNCCYLTESRYWSDFYAIE